MNVKTGWKQGCGGLKRKKAFKYIHMIYSAHRQTPWEDINHEIMIDNLNMWVHNFLGMAGLFSLCDFILLSLI